MALTNPDEVFYAGTAKEMAQQHTWSVPYLFGKPQFEKPILTYWLLRFGFIIFGVSSFTARFFPALFAIFGILAVYFLCGVVFGNKAKAFLCALVLMLSVFYIGMARSVFTDMIFSVFILFSLISFYLAYHDRRWKNSGIILFFVFSALAVLTKGPLGLIIPLSVAVAFLAIKREANSFLSRYLLLGVASFLIIAVPWYWFIISHFGDNFIKEFFYNDHIRRLLVAEHRRNDTWYFYPVSMILCMFPWCIFLIASGVSLLKKLWQRKASSLHFFLFCWVAVVFVIFQAAHSKLINYILPLFPALAIITGDYIYETAFTAKRKFKAISIGTLLAFLLFPIGLIVASYKYPMYVSGRAPLYIFFAIFFAAIIIEINIIRKKPLVLPHAAVFNIMILLLFIFSYHSRFEEYVSSERSGEYLKKICRPDSIILCSKSLARGIRFYTGNEIAIFRNGKGNFFSPHPIPFLSTDEEVKNFLARQPVTYGVLDKSSLANINRIIGDRFKYSLLNNFGGEYIIVIRAGQHRQ